jgi:hypothetical protein
MSTTGYLACWAVGGLIGAFSPQITDAAVALWKKATR